MLCTKRLTLTMANCALYSWIPAGTLPWEEKKNKVAVIFLGNYLFFFLAMFWKRQRKCLLDMIFTFLYLLRGCCFVISTPPLFVVNSVLETEKKKVLFCQLPLSHWFPHPVHAPNGSWNECSVCFYFLPLSAHLCQGPAAIQAARTLILPPPRDRQTEGKKGEGMMCPLLLGLEP